MKADVYTFDVHRTVEDTFREAVPDAVVPSWPAPMSLVRTAIAQEFVFEHTNHGEDREFMKWITKTKIRDPNNCWTPRFKVAHIPKVLYHAHYRHKKPEFDGKHFHHPSLRVAHG